MDLFTWQTRGQSSTNGQEIRSYVLAGHLYGIAVDATGGLNGPFVTGYIYDNESDGEARSTVLWETQLDEKNGYTVGSPVAAHLAEHSLYEWDDAERRAANGEEIAGFLLRLRRTILLAAGAGAGDVPKVSPMVIVGPKGPTGSIPVGSMWIHTDDDGPEFYTVPAGEGLSYSASKGFTITMDIDKVDPEVLRILVGDANTIQPMSLGIESTVQPMSLETDGD